MTPSILTEGFVVFLGPPTPEIKPRTLSLTAFQFYCSLLSVTFQFMYCEMLSVPLNNSYPIYRFHKLRTGP